jgi:hypothetical protein
MFESGNPYPWCGYDRKNRATLRVLQRLRVINSTPWMMMSGEASACGAAGHCLASSSCVSLSLDSWVLLHTAVSFQRLSFTSSSSSPFLG